MHLLKKCPEFVSYMKQNWAAYSILNVPENLSAKRNQISEDIFIPEEEKKKKSLQWVFKILQFSKNSHN